LLTLLCFSRFYFHRFLSQVQEGHRIKVPDFNVHGLAVLPGGKRIQSGTLTFYKVSKEFSPNDRTDTQIIRGKFQARLDPGEYYITSIDDRDSGYIQVSTRITVEEGKPYYIDVLSDFHKIHGDVVWEDNEQVTGTFTVRNIDIETNYTGVIKDGVVTAYLQDGVYRLLSLTLDGDNLYVIPSDEIIFISVKGQDILDYKLVIPSYNLRGTIYNEEGIVVDQGTVHVSCNKVDTYYGKIIEGKLQMIVPKGFCTVSDYVTYEPFKSYQVYAPFEVKDEMIELDIHIKPKNTHGKLIIDLPETSKYMGVSLWKIDEPNMLLYNIRLNDMEFTEYLPPGSYKAYSYHYENENIAISQTFEILKDSWNEINIVVPD
jgi:hypothetical protein